MTITRKTRPHHQPKNMKTIFFSVVLFLLLCPQLSLSADQYRYEPSKMVESQAVLHCQSLASISLGRQEALAIAVRTKPKVIGTSHKGKKVVVVSYPYRQDKISFACIFYDYTDGQLQLIEFGHVGPNVDDITKVKLLY